MELKHHSTSLKTETLSLNANWIDYIVFINEGNILFDIAKHLINDKSVIKTFRLVLRTSEYRQNTT